MAVVEVPLTLEYRGGQLNAAPILEVENFTNWKKRNTNHVKDPKLSSISSKLKYEENLINSIHKTEKNKSLVSATPFLTAFISTSIVQDFQDSPDDEEDTRSSHEYLNDLEEEYQARALLAKSKIFFKKGTQRFSSAKATDQIECHKCGKKGHFTRDCWSKASVPSYQSPFQLKPLSSSQHKPELRPTKDFKDKYNKVKAKLALLSSSASASIAVRLRTKVSSLKLMNGIKKCHQMTMRWWRILLAESQRNTTDPSVAITDSLATDYDSADESSVCSTPLPLLKKLDGDEPISGQKTIKSILSVNPNSNRKRKVFQPERLARFAWHGYAVSSLMDMAYWSSE
ncbi:retrovirus-related pol polyprotein from transposon TNT 1-94 [Tanacetum coccineum]